MAKMAEFTRLAIQVCLDCTKRHEEIIEILTLRHSIPPRSGDLCPRLLQGAGEGRLLDPGAIEAAEGICGVKRLRGGARIHRR